MEQTDNTLISFNGVVDRYKGLEIVDIDQFPQSEEAFEKQMEFNMSQWKEQGIRSVQIKFAPPKCHLMNVASKFGFYFHHANAKNNYVLMCLWMDPTTHDKIPSYADHYVGVGGVVVNDKNEILLIQERRSPEPKPWKFPGGFMDPGETIKQACEREVLEETGVKTEFQGLIGIREMTETIRYGTSDFYIVCLMKLKDGNGEINIIDKREIFDAKWIPINELTNNEEGTKYKMFPNAWKFIQYLHKFAIKTSVEKEQVQQDQESKTASDLFKAIALTHEQQDPSHIYAETDLKWNYYIPSLLKEEHSL